MARKNTFTRRTRRTVLIVGEGDTEKAFLDYLKSLYTRDSGVAVTIRNAHGKSPWNVVNAAVRHAKNGDYDIVAVLMDMDLPWTDDVRKLAGKHRMCLVGANPCIDGMLLQVLGKRVPERSSLCKTAFHEYLGRKPFERTAYERDFPKLMLDEQRNQIPALGKLLELMVGHLPSSD